MFSIDLDHPDVAGVKKRLKTVRYKKGSIILRPEDDTDLLFIVKSGFLKAYTVNARSEEAIVGIIGKGDIFPIAWIIGQRRLYILIQAISDCIVDTIPQKEFQECMTQSAKLTYEVMQKIMEQYMLHMSAINNLSLKYGRERLAYRLILLSTIFGENKNSSIVLPHISQFDLAAMVNISREGISREMSRFDRMSIIKYSSKSIEILDIKRLHKELGENVFVMFYDSDKQ